MTASHDKVVREQLVNLLREGRAHRSFESVIENWPEDLRGRKSNGLPYTAWELLEHLRLAQSDILEFSRNPSHESPEWPAGYWPESKRPPTIDAWDNSVKAFLADRQTMQDLIADTSSDLYTPFERGEGQNLLCEALTLADHNAYHLGELVVLRRLLGAWTES